MDWIRRTAFLLLLLCPGAGPAGADNLTCLQSPSVACLGELASQHAKALPRSEHWRAIAESLAQVGRTGDAKAMAVRLSGWDRSFLEKTIAVIDSVRNIRMGLGETALAPILGLEDSKVSEDRTLSRNDRMSSALHLLALHLLGEQPFSRSGEPWLVDAEKAHAARNRPQPDAALAAILRHWSQIIDGTSDWKRRADRIKFADVNAMAGHFEEARRVLATLDQSEPRRGWSWQLVRAWLRAGDPDRALAAAMKEADVKRLASDLAEVAQAYILLGRDADATKAIETGFAAMEGKAAGSKMMTAYVMLLHEQRKVDPAGAVRRAEALALLAERPDLLRPFNLARAAAVFNDLKQSARARALLERAIASVPPPDRIVGQGFHMGPIRYNRSGLGGEAIQLIAVELYRSGDPQTAIELIKQAEPLFRRRACIGIVRNQLRDGDALFDPTTLIEAMGPHAASELLLVAAAYHVEVGDIARAKTLFQRAVGAPWPPDAAHASALGRNFVRVAALLGEPSLVAKALSSTLQRALSVANPDRRALHVASLAALAHAVLPE